MTATPPPADLAPESRAFFLAMSALEIDPAAVGSAAGRRRAALAERTLMPPKPAVERVEELSIEGPDGPVELRVYEPPGDAPQRSILWMHGGGWVIGDLEHTDVDARGLCRDTDSRVVSVGYRLAPEHPFPAGLEDSYAALAWLGGEIDAGRAPAGLSVAGDSAGGNLAAALCLLARERGGPTIERQLLIYPVTDRGCDTDSFRRFGEGYLLSAADMRWYWDAYAGRRGPDPLASVLRAAGLSDLPPATIVIAGCDVLRDEGEAYAARLTAAGVAVEVLRYPGQLHAFWTFAGGGELARRVNAEALATFG